MSFFETALRHEADEMRSLQKSTFHLLQTVCANVLPFRMNEYASLDLNIYIYKHAIPT